jgi:hypothetical protein
VESFVLEEAMSIRVHPGRLSTKSAPKACDGVTKPRGADNELILVAISRALFAVKSYGSGVDRVAFADSLEESTASAQMVDRCLPRSAGVGPSGRWRMIASKVLCPARLRSSGQNVLLRRSAERKKLVRRK